MNLLKSVVYFSPKTLAQLQCLIRDILGIVEHGVAL